MKIRNGFVSNSSTTSFVLFGYLVEDDVAKRYIVDVLGKSISADDEDDIQDVIWDMDDKYMEILGEMGIGIGYTILISSDDGVLEDDIVDLSNLLFEINKIGEKLGLGPPKLITGSYSS